MNDFLENYRRVHAMVRDDGCTWDLSDNDKDALRHVLLLVQSMAGDLSEATGLSVGDVIKHYATSIAKGVK